LLSLAGGLGRRLGGLLLLLLLLLL